MKIFLLILLIAIFLQASVVNLNLCLILLVVRSLVVEKRENLYLAFIAGIFLGLLTTRNLGFYPLVFVLLIKLLSILNRSRVTPANYLLVLPICAIIFTSFEYLELFLFGQSVKFIKIIVEILLVIPIFLITTILEDRFTPKGGMKLKM